MAGCATIDTSVMETADTLRPGSIKAGIFHTTNLVIDDIMQVENPQAKGLVNFKKIPHQNGTSGIRASFGVTENTEVIAKACSGSTCKIGLKYKFPSENPNQIVAIIPTYSYFSAKFDENGSSWAKSDYNAEKYHCYGYELPVLFTTKTSDNSSYTFSVRAAFYPVDFEKNYHVYNGHSYVLESYKGQKKVLVGGIGYNVNVASSNFYFSPYFGIDYVHVDGGKKGFVPNIGIGYGFQINPQILFK